MVQDDNNDTLENLSDLEIPCVLDCIVKSTADVRYETMYQILYRYWDSTIISGIQTTKRKASSCSSILTPLRPPTKDCHTEPNDVQTTVLMFGRSTTIAN
jgi:hypothetical protein